MFKKILFVVGLVYLLVAGVAAAQPGGLLDGKAFTNNVSGTKSFALTDNNESTSVRSLDDYWYYTSTIAMEIDSYYIKTGPSKSSKVTFYDSAGQLLYSVASGAGGKVVLPTTIKNVTRITLPRSSIGDSLYIYEFDVFGAFALEMPTNLKVTPDVRVLDLSFTKAANSVQTLIYVNGSERTRIPGTSYRLEGMEPDVPVRIQFASLYGDGNVSPLTDPITSAAYPEKVKPDISPIASWNSVSFNWPDPTKTGGKDYVVIRDDGREIKINQKDSAVVIGENYSYFMRYTDKYGRIVETEPVGVKIPEKPLDTEPPDKPKGFTASATTDRKSINLYWVKGTEIDLAGYDLYIQTESGYEKLNTSLLTGTSYGYSKSVEIGKTYTFRLIAVDTSGNRSEPTNVSVKVEPVPVTDSNQNETTDFLLVTWKETPEAIGYRIYLNGRLVGSVGVNVFEFKITKAMGYIPGALVNRAEVKAIFSDGSEGGSSNPGTGGGALEDALSFIGVNEMIDVSLDFLLIYAPWILLVIGIIFSPVLYGLVVKLVNYSRRKTDVPAVKGTVLNPYEKRR